MAQLGSFYPSFLLVFSLSPLSLSLSLSLSISPFYSCFRFFILFLSHVLLSVFSQEPSPSLIHIFDVSFSVYTDLKNNTFKHRAFSPERGETFLHVTRSFKNFARCYYKLYSIGGQSTRYHVKKFFFSFITKFHQNTQKIPHLLFNLSI